MASNRNGMARFVKNRVASPGLEQRPLTAQPSARRAAIGQNAKVSMNQANTAARAQPSRPQTRGQDGSMGNGVASHAMPGHQANSYASHDHDPYGTDVDNFDDTTTASVVQVEDSQANPHDIPHAPQRMNYGDQDELQGSDVEGSEDEGSQDYEEEDEDYENDGDHTQQGIDFSQPFDQFGQAFPPEAMNQVNYMAQVFQNANQYNPNNGIFALSTNSYPTTTSGIAEGNVEIEVDEVQRQRYNDLGEQSEMTRAMTVTTHARQPLEPPQRHVIQQPPARAPLPPAQPPIGTQQQQQPARHNVPAPQLFAPRSLTQPATNRRQSAKSRQPTVNVTAPAAIQQPTQNRAPITPEPSVPGTSDPIFQDRRQTVAVHQHEAVTEPEPDLLDYSPEVIKAKSYAQLQDEDYDHDSNCPEAVLTREEEQQDLSARLGTARKLEAEQQRTFFARLTLDEWEQAGDWFLEQFSILLEGMKNSRRERRKLAQEFEAEVAERDRCVDKKKRSIDEALSGMRTSGSQVLPGTPKKQRVQ